DHPPAPLPLERRTVTRDPPGEPHVLGRLDPHDEGCERLREQARGADALDDEEVRERHRVPLDVPAETPVVPPVPARCPRRERREHPLEEPLRSLLEPRPP